MDWIEALLIAVWVALATFLAGLRLAAESRRRSGTGASSAFPAWAGNRIGLNRDSASREAGETGTARS